MKSTPILVTDKMYMESYEPGHSEELTDVLSGKLSFNFIEKDL